MERDDDREKMPAPRYTHSPEYALGDAAMNMASRFSPSTPTGVTRPSDGPTAQSTTPPPQHDARALTGGGVLAQIVLDGQNYSLRITRAGKLILTK